MARDLIDVMDNSMASCGTKVQLAGDQLGGDKVLLASLSACLMYCLFV